MNNLTLTSKNRTFTNSDITAEKFNLDESLCSSGALVFGSCETNTIKTQVRCLEPLMSEVFKVTLNDVTLGDFMVIEDKPTANKCYRDLKLVDNMYRIVNADMTNWYNAQPFPMTLKAFRESFFSYLGIEQVNVSLPMDDLVLTKIEEVEVITGKTIITCICQLNGCFGTINDSGQFTYVWLESMIVPSETLYPSEDLYPGMDRIDYEYTRSQYSKCEYEDYEVAPITGIVITDNQNNLMASVGQDNMYTISDNFLLYGKTEAECQQVAETLWPIISDICFVPVKVTAIGNINMKIGDYIEIVLSESRTIRTFVLQRTLSGIQALHDSIESDCKQYVSENQNTMSSAIKYMKAEQEKNSMKIGNLEADNVVIRGNLEAASAKIVELEADNVVINGTLVAQEAKIGALEADHVSVADLNAVNVEVSGKLSTSQLSAEISAMESVVAKAVTSSEYRVVYGNRQPTLKPMQILINGQQYIILGVEYTG